GRNDYHLAACLDRVLAKVVEQVVDARVVERREFDRAGFRIEAAGNQAIGLDQQSGDAAGDSRSGDLSEVCAAAIFCARRPELVDKSVESFQVSGEQELPGALAQLIQRQGARVSVDR